MSLGICLRYESQRQTGRVLVIDADRDATSSLARLLGEFGCDVSYTYDARLALLYARKCRPHVVLIDPSTPHMSSLPLLHAFRDERTLAGCGLIALSAKIDKHSGFDGFLAKPVARGELEAAIRPFVPLPVSDATVPLLLPTPG